MPTVRNVSGRDLEVAGRVFTAGEPAVVGSGEAEYLATNPNFEAVKEVSKPKPDAVVDAPNTEKKV